MLESTLIYVPNKCLVGTRLKVCNFNWKMNLIKGIFKDFDGIFWNIYFLEQVSVAADNPWKIFMIYK